MVLLSAFSDQVDELAVELRAFDKILCVTYVLAEHALLRSSRRGKKALDTTVLHGQVQAAAGGDQAVPCR
jgi:hypothetical protein